MLITERKKIEQMIKLMTLAFFLMVSITMAVPMAVEAQGFAGAPVPYNYRQDDTQMYEPMPPPIGNGDMAPPVEPGDLGPALPPPSGQADQTTGNIFPTKVGRDRTVVYVFVNGRMMQTIRPDQLTDQQIAEINSILGIKMLSGQQIIEVEATNNQIVQIQQVMMAWPRGWRMVNHNGRMYKQIVKDMPAAGYPKPGRGNTGVTVNGQFKEFGDNIIKKLPTVRVFSRYLVILGCVCACLWLSHEAISVVLGHPGAGMRVAQTFFGLGVLLMAFTIYKLVQLEAIHSFGAPHPHPWVDTSPFANDLHHTAEVKDEYLTAPDVPGIPAEDRLGPDRAGVPVEPLGAPQYE